MTPRPMFALAGKELRDILRERSIVVAIVVQLFIAGFSAFLSAGLSGLYDPSAPHVLPAVDVGYAGPGGFDHYLVAHPNLHVHTIDVATGRSEFAAGRLNAVIEETGTSNGVRTISLLLPDGTIEGTLLLTQLKSLLQDYEHDLRLQRQDRLHQTILEVTPALPSGSSSYAFVYANLLPLLVFTPIFLSGAIAGDAFVQEVQSRSLLVLRSTPLSGSALVAGKLLVPVLLAPLEVALWVFLFALNHMVVHGLVALLTLTALLTLLMASLSIALASWVRHEGQVQAAYALLVLLLAVSSLLLPHNPLNLVALLATGSVPWRGWLTFGLLGLVSLAVPVWALPFAARRIRRDQV